MPVCARHVSWIRPAIAGAAIAFIGPLFAGCGSGSAGTTPTPFLPLNLPSPAHDGPSVILAGQDNKFDKAAISADANDDFSIVFVNNDAAPHNVAIYTNENAEEEIFVGETFTGPGEYREYTFTAPGKGDYFFRCDVHPTTMTGELSVD